MKSRSLLLLFMFPAYSHPPPLSCFAYEKRPYINYGHLFHANIPIVQKNKKELVTYAIKGYTTYKLHKKYTQNISKHDLVRECFILFNKKSHLTISQSREHSNTLISYNSNCFSPQKRIVPPTTETNEKLS